MYVGYRKQIKSAVKQEVIDYLQKCSVEKVDELNAKVVQTAKKRIASRLNCYQTEVFFVDTTSYAPIFSFLHPYGDEVTGGIYTHNGESLDISFAVTNTPINIHESKSEVFKIDPRYIGALDGCNCFIIKKQSNHWDCFKESNDVVGAISIGKAIMDECNPVTFAEKSAKLKAVTDYMATVLPSIKGVTVVMPENRVNNIICFSIEGCEWETASALLKIYNIDLGERLTTDNELITISLGSEATVKEAAKICRSVKLVTTRLARTRRKPKNEAMEDDSQRIPD